MGIENRWRDDSIAWDARPRSAQLRTAPHTYLGDGTHAGTRWWLEVVPGTLAPVLTLQLRTAAGHELRQHERPGATVATVGPLIDVILADEAAAQSRTRKRRAPAG